MNKQMQVVNRKESNEGMSPGRSRKEKAVRRDPVIRLPLYPALSLVLALAIAGCAAASPSASVNTVNESGGQNAAPVAPPQIHLDAGSLAALEGTLQNIYTEVNPSVVNVRVVEQTTGPSLPQIPGFPFSLPPDQQAPQEQQGLGSGFVWDKEGHIVTNNHVVDGASKIFVTLHDGTAVEAKVVGVDPDSDLAVIQANLAADELQPVALGDSANVKVGQLAIAIGNPFGLEGTMTVGIVSALARSLPVESGGTQSAGFTMPDIIQTDAPVNPGNSGGVLLDAAGKVIGVTSAIISPVRASSGIGFAIPSDIVKKVVPELIAKGRYEHPWLGISGTSLTSALAEAMNLAPTQRGALVVDVMTGGPAEMAGLRGSDQSATVNGESVRVGGDVIIAIDKQPVRDFEDVAAFLAREGEVGKVVTLEILRDGKEQSLQLTLEKRPSQLATAESSQPSGTSWLGILGTTLTTDIAKAMDLSRDQKGVLVEEVTQGSPAEKAGLLGSSEPFTLDGLEILIGGDVIVKLDGKTVDRIETLQSMVRASDPGTEVTLGILRDGKPMQLSVTLEAMP
jgi:2-alkenal reductase